MGNNMQITIDQMGKISGAHAAVRGEELVCEAIAKNGHARIILATGSSQFELLEALVTSKDIDWSKCTVFHLDEYIGLSQQHPASFVNYLIQRFVDQVPTLGHFEMINGEMVDMDDEINRLNAAISKAPIDVAFIGIGENGHLAFNDPPADFNTQQPYIQVELDKACREQQVSEGWFGDISQVPTKAITMSIWQILKSNSIICTVPDERKAKAVQQAVEGPYGSDCPASALQNHSHTQLFLDRFAASKLSMSVANA